MTRFRFFSRFRTTVTCALAVTIAVLSIPLGANAAPLRPRPLSSKPANSQVPLGYDPSRIQVKFVDDLDIGLDLSGRPFDRSGASLMEPAAQVVLDKIAVSGGTWQRNTGADEATLDRMRETAQQNLGREIADLNNYFVVDVPAGRDAAEWMNDLNALADVELAFPMPLAMPAPVPGDLTDDQGYLDAATDGIDAEFAWTLAGGTGGNVTIVDLEYSWNLNHQDLPAITTVVPPGRTADDPFDDDDHGTAVLGELASVDNAFGTTGAAFGATIRVAPTNFTDGYLLNEAFQNAVAGLGAGDCALFEQQIAGPNFPGGNTQFGLVAVEWDQAVYNSIVTAVGNGIHVIEAAGNGSQDFDDAVYGMGNGGHWPFLPANDSGAIIVGAGAAPAAFGGSTTDRSRLGFSNWGSTVDLQGWGEDVVTTGYGDEYSAEGHDLLYTDTFGGTSSASPIVTSAVALLESFHEAELGGVITPAAARQLLIDTGSPQQSGANPDTEHIGPRPDLGAAICTFDTEAPSLVCPASITVECLAPGGTSASNPAIAAFLAGATATDNIDPSPDVTNDAPAFFPEGATTVTFTATDDCGNSSTCQATVTVDDTVPPVIVCPASITVECSDFCGTPADDPQLAEFVATATDVCDADVVPTSDAPACFPEGATVVTFTAQDDAGNTSTCQATVTVEDTTPPELTTSLDRDELWPPNHKLVEIGASVEVTDICDPNPTFVLTSITSDEPDNGLGDGDAPNDIQNAAFGTADTTFSLRSERAGGGDGRVYTVIYTASDASGNTTSDTLYVTVPHDQSGAANAAGGYAADGRSLVPEAVTFQIAFLTTPVRDARLIDQETVFVGNHLAIYRSVGSMLIDLNGDSAEDLVVVFDAAPVIYLSHEKEEGVVEPVAMRYEDANGAGYLVLDIFALGPPVVPTAVGVDDVTPLAEMYRVQPNPFGSVTRMGYAVESAGARVEIAVFDAAGRRVRQLVSGTKAAGRYEVTWDGRGESGAPMPAGVYFLRVWTGTRQVVNRVTLVR